MSREARFDALAEVLANELDIDMTPAYLDSVVRLVASLALAGYAVTELNGRQAHAMDQVVCDCGCGRPGIRLLDENDDTIGVGKMEPGRMIDFCRGMIEFVEKKA
jgi:hypothetical protein